ncbi:MAG: YbgC/FadM family acyl-CoA thioesterase [Alphaproteobacteria bacterium]
MTDTPDSNSRQWPDLSGRIEDGRHILPVRVYFEDTDFSGLVYHTSYLRWCERGRSDFVRLRGVHHNELYAGANGGEPAAFVVRRMEVDYRRPARIDEVVEVITECVETGAAHLIIAQRVERSGEVLCKVRVQVVLINSAGRPLRIPAALRNMM